MTSLDTLMEEADLELNLRLPTVAVGCTTQRVDASSQPLWNCSSQTNSWSK